MGWGIPCDARRLYVVLLQRFRVDAVGITNAKRRVSFVVLLVIGALEDHDAWNRFVGDGSLELGGAAHGPATHAHRSLNLAAMLNVVRHCVRCSNERKQEKHPVLLGHATPTVPSLTRPRQEEREQNRIIEPMHPMQELGFC